MGRSGGSLTAIRERSLSTYTLSSPAAVVAIIYRWQLTSWRKILTEPKPIEMPRVDIALDNRSFPLGVAEEDNQTDGHIRQSSEEKL